MARMRARSPARTRMLAVLAVFAVFAAPPALGACTRAERSPTRVRVASGEPSVCILPPAASASAGAGAKTRNVEGRPLVTCSTAPLTGVYRDGRCETGPDDVGVHVVCAEVTDAFLQFSASRGNDLVTPAGSFPGLRAGQRWCLCAARWAEAEAAGVAPPVVLEATNAAALRTIEPDVLRTHAR
jgi:uncharacterized protein (DUF2237 family)